MNDHPTLLDLVWQDEEWYTADHRHYLIREMTLSHVINTFNWCARNWSAIEHAAVGMLYQAGATLNGEMSLDWVDRELTRWEESRWEDTPLYTAFKKRIDTENDPFNFIQ